MVDLRVIKAGRAELTLAPTLGGGIARLDVNGRPVLRPWLGNESDFFSLSSNVLVPFSNRISGGGFTWNGELHKISPNLSGEIFPIHGDGFSRVWSFSSSEKNPKLTLMNGKIGPWLYMAEQEFDLTSRGLTITLCITNKGTQPLPFGYGFHPWFPRNSGTKLAFKAKKVWLENTQHLPSKELLLTDDSSWQFGKLRSLPNSWINNCYTGWDGTAVIKQDFGAMSCTVTASQSLSNAIIFSPNQTSNFFCFEPVSHPVDAFNLPAKPCLKELPVGETLKTSMTFSWA